METGGSLVPPAKKPISTPKAIIRQKFGSKASFTIEEVEEFPQNECPGLAIPQKGPCLFRCHLELPEFSVVSETFKRKREAEQSASEMALDKLGISAEKSNPPLLDAADELAARLSFLFSNEFLPSLHPLSSNLKATLRREGDLYGLVPVSLMIAYDSKLCNLCKSINPLVDSNPLLAIPHIIAAASRLSELVAISDDQLCIRRQNPYPSQFTPSFADQQLSMSESLQVQAVLIPYSLDNAVRSMSLDAHSKGYYLDIIAKELGVADASKILLSRAIGKASSEMRLYFSALETRNFDSVSDFLHAKEILDCNSSFNSRASYLSGQAVYGDAILASIGYKWKSADIFHEDVPLRSYFRMIVGKAPAGLYKLSREVILVAELPVRFTSKSWRGSLPRELLFTFCRQQRLSEPIFSVAFDPKEPVPVQESAGSHGNSDFIESIIGSGNQTLCPVTADGNESAELEGTYRCEVRLMSKSQELILEYRPKESYKKQNDAVQNAALRVLSWLDMYFRQPDMPLEGINSSRVAVDIQCHDSNFSREFSLCWLILNLQQRRGSQESNLSCYHSYQPSPMIGHQIDHIKIEGPEAGMCPSNGSLVCISYIVSLITAGGSRKVVETADEFDFEIGTGAVIPCVEDAVMQITVAQSVSFYKELPPHEFILAAAADLSNILPDLTTSCYLEYSITLLHFTCPLEDKIEQAFFTPPLSKQRVEYALHHIRDSSATSLIDFGCGSGSLLDSLIGYPTSLKKIVGVDLSRKGLARAAKILHSKLMKSTSGVKQVLLYEGSITVFDSYLCGFDMGTCLEVIEHMEEEEASLFGNIVLASFRPKILIVSTPNYEYNVILQRSNLSGHEDDPDEKGEPQSHSCRFRNHDHKFEWTRKQFNSWATGLSVRHGYSVEFDGVGGSADVEPGFASQIAVFRRLPCGESETSGTENADARQRHHCELIWEWNAAANQTLSDSVPRADSDTSEHSDSPAKRRRRSGDDGRGDQQQQETGTGIGIGTGTGIAIGTSYPSTSTTVLEESSVGSAISRSASIIVEAIHASEEKEERRHRELLSLHERRLKLEESEVDMNRQGVNDLVQAINNLANSLLSLASHQNQPQPQPPK
ncbi:hypothetical protein Dimus_015460 [Dionaea muscipula]